MKRSIHFAGFADLEGHPEIEKTVKDKNNSNVSVFFREQLSSGHGDELVKLNSELC